MINVNSVGEKQVIVLCGETERDIIKQMCIVALENNSYCISRAAKSLGINRTTLRMRLSTWEDLRNACDKIQALQAQRIS